MAEGGTGEGEWVRQSNEDPSPSERTSRGSVQGIVARRVSRFGRRHRFTEREEQIFLRLVLGKHPKAIGTSLGCEYETVRTHIRRIQKKLGCAGTRELLVRFISELCLGAGPQAGRTFDSR